MGHRHQNSDCGTGDCAWLNTLIGAFEQTEELGNVPCDANTVSATMSRLQRSSTVRASSTRAQASQRRRQPTLELHN